LIQLSAISQSKLVINGDTVITITQNQLRSANQLFSERLMYQEYSDSLFLQNGRQELKSMMIGRQNDLKTKEIVLMKENLYLCDSINKIKEEKVMLLNKTIKAEQAKKTKSFFIGVGSGFVIGILTAILTGISK